MREDTELLRRYVEFHSEADFTELVRRNLSLVYHAALRRTGGRADLAEEVSQYVFTTLACKAPDLLAHPVLAGWLYATTRHAAHTVLRTERRRQTRELEAQRMSDLDTTGPEPEWERVRAELDGVLDQLPDRDREAILLRFFHDRAFAQIGAAFGLSEDAARKRVDRALERLRGQLDKRGITSTSAALATMLAGQAALAAPTGLIQTVSGAALAQAAAVALPAAGIIPFMGTKTTLSIAGVLGLAGLLSVPTVGIALYEMREARHAEAAVALAQGEYTAGETRLQELQKNVAETDRRAAEIQAGLEKARASLVTTPPRPATNPPPVNKAAETARSDGDKFMATFGQAQPMLMEIGRAQITRNFAGFYRFASLTPAQIDELETRTAEFWIANIAVTPKSVTPTVGQLPDEQLRQILGADGFQKLQDYNRVRPAYEIARQVGMTVGYFTAPLSDEQSNQLIQAVTDNSSSYQSGGKLDMGTVNWDATVAQVKTSLTPAQWQAVEPMLLNFQFKQALNQAHQKAVATENAKPKS